MKDIVYEENHKLDIFESISLKFANLESERKITNSQLDFDVKRLDTRAGEIEERMGI